MTAPDDIHPPTSRPKPKTDWEAVERDYRTGKFTVRELGVKHGVSYSLIARRAKKDEWPQDLAVVIRQATNARLTNSLVESEVHKSSQAVHEIVSAAVDVNTRIILGHRTRLTDLADAVDQAKAKLLSLGDTVADIREAATFVQAVGNLATSTKTLIEQERKAHNLDDAPPDEEKTAHTVRVKFV